MGKTDAIGANRSTSGVTHDERGEPAEIYFWGYSGD
jgi:hypothetical protein